VSRAVLKQVCLLLVSTTDKTITAVPAPTVVTTRQPAPTIVPPTPRPRPTPKGYDDDDVAMEGLSASDTDVAEAENLEQLSGSDESEELPNASDLAFIDDGSGSEAEGDVDECSSEEDVIIHHRRRPKQY